MKSDIDKYLESDEELIKAKQKIDYLETVVNYLDRTLKIIGGRDWQIRNSISGENLLLVKNLMFLQEVHYILRTLSIDECGI